MGPATRTFADRRVALGALMRLVAGTGAVGAATTTEAVAECLDIALVDLIGAEVVLTFVGGEAGAGTFAQVGHVPAVGDDDAPEPTHGAARAIVGSLSATSADEVLGAETVAQLAPALASGELTFVDHPLTGAAADGPPALEGIRSLLVAPLTGERHQLIGFVLCGWGRPVAALSPIAQDGVGLLVAEAERAFCRDQHAAGRNPGSTTDPLTGLLNRRAIEVHLEDLEPGDVIVVLDLDHFGEVNDRHGRAAGDRTLRSLAACLVDTCRKRDWCGRLGGEEFVLVVRGAGANPGRAVMRLRERWLTLDPLTTFSAGVAVHHEGSTAGLTLTQADEALYRAKDLGRDRVEVRSPQG